jgi:hypothetical protein
MSKGMNEKVTKGEEYLKGRRAGQEGTHGMARKGVAEKTIYPGERDSDGGGEDGLGECASRLYQNAVHNRGDKDGDKALTER